MSTAALPSPGASSAGPIPSGGGGDAELGSLLSGAYDSVTGDAPDTGDVDISSGNDTPDLGTPQPEISDPAVPTNPAQPAEAVADPSAPYPLSADGNSYQIPKADFPQLQSAKQYFDQVGQIFSTPQEAQAASQQAADMRIMSNDWISGNDGAIAGVLNHWAGANERNPAVAARMQQSFAKMANHIPQMLQRINPQAHQAMTQQVISGQIAAAYQKAAANQKPTDYDANGVPLPDSPLRQAQDMDFGFTGQYKTDLSQVQQQAPVAPGQQQRPGQQSPEAQRLEATYQRDLSNDFMVQTEGSSLKGTGRFGDLAAKVDSLLKPVAGRYPEKTLKAVKNAIINEVVEKVNTDRPDWKVEHEQEFYALRNEYRDAWMRGDSQPSARLTARIQAYRQSFANQAQRVLPAIVKEHMTAANANQQGNAQRAQNGRFAANQPQTGTSTTQPKTTTVDVKNPPGRMPADQWDQEFAAAFK